ncbi:MAG: DNA repair protein RadC [Patescibacteria group bacterium]
MKIKDLHPSDRPREKLIKLGSKRLTNKELLAIIINIGSKGKNALELAFEILQDLSLPEFFEIDYENLVKLPGINQAKACQIIAIKELIERNQKTDNSAIQIQESKIAAIYFEDLRQSKKERVMVLYLNVHNEVIWKETITIGTVETTLIHPRDIFEPAVRYLASGIVIAHNHPGGDISPSEADIKTTEQIVQAGKILGIEVLDHLIITKKGYFSFKDEMML